MIYVYIDYPTSHIRIHGDPSCQFIRPFGKPEQRTSRITLETLSDELAKFADKEYRFASVAVLNDIWLEIHLDDDEFERAVAKYVLKLIGRHYTPIRQIELIEHC